MIAWRSIILVAGPLARVAGVWATDTVMHLLENPHSFPALRDGAKWHVVRVRGTHRLMLLAHPREAEAGGALLARADRVVSFVPENEGDLPHAFEQRAQVRGCRVRQPTVGGVMAGRVKLQPREVGEVEQERGRHVVPGIRLVIAGGGENPKKVGPEGARDTHPYR